MRKAVAIALVLLVCGAFAASAAPQQKFIIGAGTGLYYDYGAINTGLGFIDFLLALRGEVYASFTYKFADIIGVGAELGVGYITDGESWGLFDIPLRAIGTIDLKLITLQPFVGLMLTAWSGYPFAANFEAGGRVVLFGSFTGLYLEASYVMGPISFPRFGLGYQLKLIGF
jgi:hypothetical protein